MTDAVWDDELTLELSRAVVERTSPEELPVFEAIATSYAQEGIRPVQRSDGSLGFGAEILPLSVVIVPVVEAAGKAVVALLPGVAADVAAGELKELFRRMFRKGERTIAVPARAVDDAREAAFSQARSLGLAEDQAALLANVVAKSFAPAKP